MNIIKDEVYTFKLVNGEEIVGKVVDIADNHYTLKQPISYMLGNQGLQPVPPLFTTVHDPEVSIMKNSIGMIAITRPDVKDAYIQTTSGISLPTKKQIITG